MAVADRRYQPDGQTPTPGPASHIDGTAPLAQRARSPDLACTWIPSGAPTGNGIGSCPIWHPFKGRTILDVGCGNGYHCWRMLGAGAERVIGIDPSAKFVFQFHAIKRFAGKHLPIDVLPLGIEHTAGKNGRL